MFKGKWLAASQWSKQFLIGLFFIVFDWFILVRMIRIPYGNGIRLDAEQIKWTVTVFNAQWLSVIRCYCDDAGQNNATWNVDILWNKCLQHFPCTGHWIWQFCNLTFKRLIMMKWNCKANENKMQLGKTHKMELNANKQKHEWQQCINTRDAHTSMTLLGVFLVRMVNKLSKEQKKNKIYVN